MEAQRSSYTYGRLNAARREIRLLHLHPKQAQPPGPANREERIQCSFSIASIDDSPAFEALSYVWGDPKEVTAISVEGHHYPVTTNLHSALMHIRLATTERILWVDALSIDQGNIEERSSQVAQMHYVYQLAAKVIVFLGEWWDGCDIAMEYIDEIGREPNLHLHPKLEPHAISQGYDAESPALSAHLIQFFSLPWFRRTWTLQEFILAREVTIVCGQHLLAGTVVRHALQNIVAHFSDCCGSSLRLISAPNTSAWDVMSRLHLAISYGNPPRGHDRFIKLLAALRSRESFDPRDKIYGLLSLGDAVVRARLRPDYSISVPEAYAKLVSFSVEISGSLNILSCVAGTSRHQLDLPTFVPDWLSSMDDVGLALHISRVTTVSTRRYTASKRSSPDFTIANFATAKTKCCFTDTIHMVEVTQQDGVSPNRGDSKEQFDEFNRVAGNLGSASPYKSSPVAFCLAMCGGLMYSRDHQRSVRPAEASDFTAFEKWQRSLTLPTYSTSSDKDFVAFRTGHVVVSWDRVFFITKRGYLGWGPPQSRTGDFVVVLPGGHVPYVLRREEYCRTSSTTPAYRFFGDAYLQGFMDGEGYDEGKLEVITLI